jgi:Tfp pilus assembly protein PilZ
MHQRREARKQYSAPVRFVLQDEDPTVFSGFVKDIAYGGAFIHTFNVPAAGAIVQLTFEVPFQDSPLALPAEVVWTREEADTKKPEQVGFGVRFLRGEDRGMLETIRVDMRSFQRVRYSSSLRFEVIGGPGVHTGFVQDISVGGVYVQTFAAPKVGDEVRIHFRVPYEEDFCDMLALVAWSRGEDKAQSIADTGFGARFSDLPGEVERRILEKIRAAESEFYA